MTRRRLILAFCGAAVALGAAWWLMSDDPLSAEEQQFVGMWKRSTDGGAMNCTLDLAADRQWLERVVVAAGWGGTDGDRWAVQDGDLLLNDDMPRMSEAPRSLRPVLRLFGINKPRSRRSAAEVEGDRLVITEANGTRTVWTRVRGD